MTSCILSCLLIVLIALGRAPIEVGVNLLALLYIIYCFVQKKITGTGTSTDVWAAFIFATIVFATALWQSISGQFNIAGLTWGRFALAYAALRVMGLEGKKYFHAAIFCSALTLALLVIDTYWQYITGISLSGQPIIESQDAANSIRLTGPLTRPNIGSMLVKFAFPVFGIAALMCKNSKHVYVMMVNGLIALFAVVVVLLTGERSASMLMLIGLCVMAGAMLIMRRSLWKPVMSIALLISIIITILALTQKVVQQRGEFFVQQVLNYPTTVYGQLHHAAWILFTQHPFAGIGTGQFLNSCATLMQSEKITYCDNHAHNIYLQVFSEYGLAGGTGLIFFVTACIKFAWETRRFVRSDQLVLYAACCGGLTVLFFPFVATQSLFSNWPAALFWSSLAFSMSGFAYLRRLDETHA